MKPEPSDSPSIHRCSCGYSDMACKFTYRNGHHRRLFPKGKFIVVETEKGKQRDVARHNYEHESDYLMAALDRLKEGYGGTTNGVAYYPNGNKVTKLIDTIAKILEANLLILQQEGKDREPDSNDTPETEPEEILEPQPEVPAEDPPALEPVNKTLEAFS